MKKIALLTLHTTAYQPLADLTMPGKQEYCERHGYTLVTSQMLPQYDPQKGLSRFAATLALLQQGYHVLWTECDVMITNHRIRIEDRLFNHDFVASADINGLNYGVYLAANTMLTQQFFFALCGGPQRVLYHEKPEQESMTRLIYRHPYQHFATMLPQRALNAYAQAHVERQRYPFYESGIWQPGDWMLHLTRDPMETRIALAHEHGTHVWR